MVEVEPHLEEEEIEIIPPDEDWGVFSREEADKLVEKVGNALAEIDRHKRKKRKEKKKQKAEELEVPEFSKEEIMERVVKVLPESEEEAERSEAGTYPTTSYFISLMILNDYYVGEPVPQGRSDEIWRYNEDLVELQDELQRRIPQLIRHRGDKYGIKSGEDSYWGVKVYWVEGDNGE